MKVHAAPFEGGGCRSFARERPTMDETRSEACVDQSPTPKMFCWRSERKELLTEAVNAGQQFERATVLRAHRRTICIEEKDQDSGSIRCCCQSPRFKDAASYVEG